MHFFQVTPVYGQRNVRNISMIHIGTIKVGKNVLRKLPRKWIWENKSSVKLQDGMKSKHCFDFREKASVLNYHTTAFRIKNSFGIGSETQSYMFLLRFLFRKPEAIVWLLCRTATIFIQVWSQKTEWPLCFAIKKENSIRCNCSILEVWSWWNFVQT